ncbi:hypothetical protein [Hyalangium gracile]|uniref:hypothetical protein n=1 Tax=Hyalangium gracile TaxID=394092 RepID=UPI001CCEE9AB|nr:hypothetical protein [Hyalangium gracile]
MINGNWGHCQHCRYFASLARIPLAGEEARCLQPELSRYDLKVFGASGCKAFELRQGLSKEVEEPTAAPHLSM